MLCKSHLIFFVVTAALVLISISSADERPNIVLFFTDDQGYSDIGCFGAVGFETPHLDKLAMEGRRFTNFYTPISVCSASRTALMTGCYPQRVSMPGVLFPTSGNPVTGEKPGPGKEGLHVNEITLANILKDRGYATCIVGKWHLGDAPPFLPTRRGFDEYLGIPYSNDMGHRDARMQFRPNSNYPPLPFYDGDKIIETEPDQRFLTRRYTERAVDFIERNKDKPFFLYIPHTMPHVPLAVHPDFAGKSEHGLYGDVMQELDWSVGEVVRTLKENGLDEKTMIVYTADNGPWQHQGEHGGHAEPLRDGKTTQYEGGHRVPCIMYWKGHINPGTVASEMLSTMDLMPTFAKLAGTTMPQDRKTDGIEAWDYISGATDVSPRKTFVFGDRIIRHGKWKLFLPGQYGESVQRDRFHSDEEWQAAMQELNSVNYESSRLYDLNTDVGESEDVSNRHPEIVADFYRTLNQIKNRLGAKPVVVTLPVGAGPPHIAIGHSVRNDSLGRKSYPLPSPHSVGMRLLVESGYGKYVHANSHSRCFRRAKSNVAHSKSVARTIIQIYHHDYSKTWSQGFSNRWNARPCSRFVRFSTDASIVSFDPRGQTR